MRLHFLHLSDTESMLVAYTFYYILLLFEHGNLHAFNHFRILHKKSLKLDLVNSEVSLHTIALQKWSWRLRVWPKEGAVHQPSIIILTIYIKGKIHLE